MQARGRTLTMIDSVFPRMLVRDVFLVIYFAGLTAFGAQLAFHIGPVPITGQTFIVLLAGALLGSKRGALSQLSYLAIGAMGAPVFAGGLGGPAVFVGPTAGYLVGFVGAAFVVGLLAERGFDRRVWSTALAMIIGSLVVYAFGLTWLSVWLSRFNPESSVLAIGLYPFLAGDAMKVALASVALPGGWALLNRLPR